MSISGTKLRTGGVVTVIKLAHRHGPEPLYLPMYAQALELGEAMAANLNRMNVRMPDRRRALYDDTPRAGRCCR